MFYDIKEFPFLHTLVEHVDIFSNELKEQMKLPFMKEFVELTPKEIYSHVAYWVKEGGFLKEQIGYDSRDGIWEAFPLYKKGFKINWYDVEQAFPETYKAITSVPNINFSAFFKLTPGSGTKEHAHIQKNLIFHLCLFDIDGESVMRCDGHEKILSKKGDYALFDYSKPHSSINHGKKDRVNLVIDFSTSL